MSQSIYQEDAERRERMATGEIQRANPCSCLQWKRSCFRQKCSVSQYLANQSLSPRDGVIVDELINEFVLSYTFLILMKKPEVFHSTL